MGLFTLFRKRNAEDVISAVSQDVVTAAITARNVLTDNNDPRSSQVCSEVVYLLLHLVDRELFKLFGQKGRDHFLDRIVERVLAVYVLSVLTHQMPQVDATELGGTMLKTFNSRQQTYANCTSILGEGGSEATSMTFPRPGSMVFALCFFIRKSLGQTVAKDPEEILAGKADISSIDLQTIPDIESLVRGAIFIGATMKEIRLGASLKQLR